MLLLLAVTLQLFAGVTVTVNVNDLLNGKKDPYLTTNHAVLEKLVGDEVSSELSSIPMDGSNVIQFRLNKEGKLSNLTLVESSNSQLLDALSTDGVINAFWKFPKPAQTTIFRIKFDYQK